MNALRSSLSYPPWQRIYLYLGLSTPQCQDAVHIFGMKLNLILALSRQICAAPVRSLLCLQAAYRSWLCLRQ